MAGDYRSGQNQPQTTPVATATAIANNDLLAIASGLAVPAASWPWTTDELTTRTAFVAAFIGSSSQTKAAGAARAFGNSNDNLIGVNEDGNYEYDCVAGTYTKGMLLGPAKDTGNNLLSSTLKAATGTADATHIVQETTVAGATRVFCSTREVGLLV